MVKWFSVRKRTKTGQAELATCKQKWGKLMLQRLKQVRKALGYSQTEFAKYLGITQTSYSMIENGIRPLSNKYVRIISITFNVSEQYLVNGQGEMFVSSPHEKELLNLFSQLLPDTQNYLLVMVKELLKMQQKIVKCEVSKNNDLCKDNTEGDVV